ncbi:MAG: hypothetical protein K8W52_19175 [Deltaproteobacteria bacterium]|nr:hypothetical protein [Deltaproteobacteria bacterium]
MLLRRLPLVLILAGGCTYQVNRAATVPHMSPIMRSGAPLESVAEISVGASSLTTITNPTASDSTAAVEVPGTQLEGGGRVRVGKHVALGLVMAEGLEATAKPAKTTQVPVDNGDPRGYGFSMLASIPTSDPHWHVGLGLEVLAWSVPYVEYKVCIDCGGAGFQIQEKGRNSVGQVALAVTPTYRSGKVDVYGGLTVRNHPTIKQKGIENGLDLSDDVEAGPLNVVASVGVDVDLGGGVRGGAVLYTPINGTPVRYGPSIGAMLTFPLGRDAARAAAPAAAPGAAPGAVQ